MGRCLEKRKPGKLFRHCDLDCCCRLLLGLFFFRKRPFKQRLSWTIPVAFILFSLAAFGNAVIHEYGLFEEYNHFFAKRDILNGKVQLLSGGLILDIQTEKEQEAEEAIEREFGYQSVWVGCTWTPGMQKYNEAVENYLTERNGEGWEKRMRSRIDSLRNTSRSQRP